MVIGYGLLEIGYTLTDVFVPAVREHVTNTFVHVEVARFSVGRSHDGQCLAVDVQSFKILAAHAPVNERFPVNAVEVHDLDVAVVIEEDVAAGVVAVQRSCLVHAGCELADGG